MNVAGISPFDAIKVARAARENATSRPVVVSGMLARELARELSADGDASLVRADGPVEGAAALVVVLGGQPDPATLRLLRAATRASVPVVAVQIGSQGARIPYVGASETVDVAPGSGFPVDEIAGRVARAAGSHAVGLAAGLPRLRPHVLGALVTRACAVCASIGALPLQPAVHLPAMLRIQQRLVLDLAAAQGQSVDPSARAPELAATSAIGLAARTAARRMPLPRRLTGAVTGYAVTRALGEAARARFAVAPGRHE